MTFYSLQQEIQQLIPLLLEMAGERTYNTIHPHCQFIMRNTKVDAEVNIHQRRKMIIKENRLKTPVPLDKIIPDLEAMQDDLYDVRLQVYRSNASSTIIEIGYFLRSSLEESYRRSVEGTPTMFHCAIELPPWLHDTNDRFDINWPFHHFRNSWKLFLYGLVLKKERRQSKNRL